jgi:hypothetical protein
MSDARARVVDALSRSAMERPVRDLPSHDTSHWAHAHHTPNKVNRAIPQHLVEQVAQQAIANIPKLNVDTNYDIPYIAGPSNSGGTVYIDSKLAQAKPETIPHLIIHETVEENVMKAFGESYDQAHKVATKYERQSVEQSGLNWKQYNDSIKPFIRKEEHKVTGPVPRDLFLEPYKEDKLKGDNALLAQMKQHME